jgi:CRISPR/Cas system-associated exonuclease Cas4 (RecB family)
MKDGAVLNIASVSNGYAVVIASEHDIEPDTGILAETDASDDSRIRCHEVVIADRLNAIVTQIVDHVSSTSGSLEILRRARQYA